MEKIVRGRRRRREVQDLETNEVYTCTVYGPLKIATSHNMYTVRV